MKSFEPTLLETTETLCPICLKRLPGEIIKKGDEISLKRICPEHGDFDEIIWRGPPDFETWRRPKIPAKVTAQNERKLGCPFDCGLCPEHGQYPCTIIFEITQNCNLSCPVCFANQNGHDFPPLETLKEQLKYISSVTGQVVLQLSGGEPTLYPHLIELTRLASDLFPAVQLNTNGLILAENPQLPLDLKEAGLSWVFLQFDGLSDQTYRLLRGRNLLDQKKKALANCELAELPVILVPTVARGINDHELGDLVRLAVARPGIRGVHFQPMTSSGRNPWTGPETRLTLPEVLTLLEAQTDIVKASLAFPPGCEHERCSFHLRYRRTPEGLIPRAGDQQSCCCRPQEPGADRTRAVDIILKSWRKPSSRPKDAFEEFLYQAQAETFSLTAMAFQDVWTVDLKRLQGCCVHVFRAPDKFIPFCAMNLTSASGRPLYRHP